MKKQSIKNDIMRLFDEGEKGFISGEQMSSSLGFSRAYIWKNIKELREDGFDIEAVPRRGYKLVSAPDRLYAYNIEPGLGTKVLGRGGIHHYDVVSSTNDKAYELAEQGSPEGTLVIAEKQTQGKGRLGRKWASPASEGIYMSVILRPEMEMDKVPTITLITANAVIKAINRGCEIEDIGVKWPNDILCGGKKVCGILTEIKAQPDKIDFLVLGIGINVNASREDLPPEGTSLKLIMGRKVDRRDLLEQLLKEVEDGYFSLERNGFSSARDECRSRSLIIGCQVKVVQHDKSIEGMAADIDSDGALVIRTESGKQQRIFSGDIVICREKLIPSASEKGS